MPTIPASKGPVLWEVAAYQDDPLTITASGYATTNELNDAWILGTCNVTFGAAGSAGEPVEVAAPMGVGARDETTCVGSFSYIPNGGTGKNHGVVWCSQTGFFTFYIDGADAPFGEEPSFAVANGDKLTFNFHYKLETADIGGA